MILKVYGAISQIFEPGVIKKCIPIFINADEKGKHTKFYRINDDEEMVEVDLKQYGTPVFLPASKKKINDGKEYFIIYRKTQNVTHPYCKCDINGSIFITLDEKDLCMEEFVTMGIKFPDKFVCVAKRFIDEDGLRKMMRWEEQ